MVRAAQVKASGLVDRRQRGWADRPSEWAHVCNICGWHGIAFAGPAHSEAADCPSCASVARDRYLHWCWTHRVRYSRRQRVLETSPRLGEQYRRHMSQVVSYVASDYDESAHRAMLKLDLQDLQLPDASFDVILTPHVLEHVPDTDAALRELFRVTAPGGSVFLMVPMATGLTAAPTEPEYHADHTLVYWNFGWDLGDKLRAAGFSVECLVTQPLIDRVRRGQFDTNLTASDMDELSLLKHAALRDLTAIAGEREAIRYGFVPDAYFIVWHGGVPTA
ncbi:MAG: methyltransferase domain-containing protein [Acidimicrobiaceae bacterium]|nr:methyltransferase domain-containing protein [Acidimicrobiaceae bacterium]